MNKRTGRPAWEAISRQSSSAVAMRSVAAALRGDFVDVWNINPLQQRALQLVSLGGRKAANSAIDRFVASSGVDPVWARRMTTEDLASWAVSLYDDVEGPWDAIIIGAPNGGVAHLAASLGIPFLSQHFASNFREAAPLDDTQAYLEQGSALAKRVLRRNRDLAVVNQYEPLHKRAWAKYTNTLHYKLLELPEIYQAFIYQNIKPGGTIIFTDCRYPWPMYFLDERHWFQVGGLGKLEPREFIEGQHPEISALQASSDSTPTGNWGLKSLMAFDMSEAEWGTLAPLHERVALFARENAYNFVSLEGGHPEYFSYLALRVWLRLMSRADLKPRGILVETGIQVAPTAVRQASLLPLWLPVNTSNSLDFLKRMQRELKSVNALKGTPVLWMPEPNCTESFDQISWDQWVNVWHGAPVYPMGMQSRLYPGDPTSLYAARQDVMSWVAEHPAPIASLATIELVLEEVRALRRQRA